RQPGGDRQGALREAEMPAVPRARRDPEGSADGEPRAGSADGAGAAESRLDRAVAEESAGDPAGHAHAVVLAAGDAAEVAVPRAGRRLRGADARDPRPPAHVPRRTEPEAQR